MQLHAGTAVVMLLLLGCTHDNPRFSLSAETPLESDGMTDDGTTDDGLGTTTKGSGSADSGSGPTTGDTTRADTEAGTTDSTGALESSSTTGETTVKYVFVTSQRYAPNELGGLDGADARCQELASAAGLRGTFRAWLSDHTGSPADRMTKAGPYLLLDERPVADSWAELVAGTLQNPIELDEHGQPAEAFVICVGGEVWTNTLSDGTARSNLHCDGWSSTQGITFVGEHTQIREAWTESGCINVTCATSLPIYCFEQ